MSPRHRLRRIVLLFLFTLVGISACVAPHAVADPEPEPEPAAPPVTVAVHTIDPFVMETSNGDLTGFSIELWEEVAERLGWTTEYLMTGDVRGQLQAVEDGSADVAIGAVSLTSGREQSFDFSQPTLDAGLQIMVPMHSARPSVPGLGGYLDLLFSRTMLIWLTAAVVVSVLPAHLFWLIERRNATPIISKSYFPGIFEAFGWGVGSLVGKNSAAPTKRVTKALAILWGFAGIVFVSFYSANLAATLTVAKLEAKINSPADLYEKKVATVADTTAASFLRDMGIDTTETRTIDDSYHLLLEEGYDAVVFDAPVLRYFAAHRGQGAVVMAGPIFQDETQGFVFDINSPLRKPINRTLFKMREEGSLNLIKEKWFGDDAATSEDGN